MGSPGSSRELRALQSAAAGLEALSNGKQVNCTVSGRFAVAVAYVISSRLLVAALAAKAWPGSCRMRLRFLCFQP